MERLNPESIGRGIAGHGIAAVFGGDADGPTVLLRSDMDALPIDETLDLAHGSETGGVAHKCGHDGHMAMAVGAAGRFVAGRPPRGRLVLLFQPAEETGEGAAGILADPAFGALRPDCAIAVHNLPGFDLGTVVVRAGVFACASRGLAAELVGATSHAAEPERGRSPALAVAQLIESWSAARQLFTGLEDSVQATVIHAAVGHPAFGTSPGEGRVMATVRATSDEALERLDERLRRLAESIAETWDLEVELRAAEPFPATVNDPKIVAVVAAAAAECGRELVEPERAFSWSEDFGHFGRRCPSVLFGLGAGTATPALHHPHYDFPDELLPIGSALLETAVQRLLERDG